MFKKEYELSHQILSCSEITSVESSKARWLHMSAPAEPRCSLKLGLKASPPKAQRSGIELEDG